MTFWAPANDTELLHRLKINGHNHQQEITIFSRKILTEILQNLESNKNKSEVFKQIECTDKYLNLLVHPKISTFSSLKLKKRELKIGQKEVDWDRCERSIERTRMYIQSNKASGPSQEDFRNFLLDRDIFDEDEATNKDDQIDNTKITKLTKLETKSTITRKLNSPNMKSYRVEVNHKNRGTHSVKMALFSVKIQILCFQPYMTIIWPYM